MLWQIAQESLEKNFVTTLGGSMTVAGGHQFKTFWVRDFCFAVPGLLALGRHEQVQRQLELCLTHPHDDGLIARGFDIVNPKLRVVAESLHLPFLRRLDFGSRKLRPEYFGEHGTPAVDSNLLVLLACAQWSERLQSDYFWREHGAALANAFNYVRRLRKLDLLAQPAFSDWLDSVRRQGETFYLNLLFYRVLRKLHAAQVPWALSEDPEVWRQHLWQNFFDPTTGLFRNQVGEQRSTLEANLWCIEEDIFAGQIAASELWANLLGSPLWHPLPGRPVYPGYAAHDISWTVKLVGLRHYHDGFYWSWLMAEGLKVATLMNARAEAQMLLAELTRLAMQYQTIHEIYEMKSGRLEPVRRPLYRSEEPFSWGAAKILEALHISLDISRVDKS